MDSMPKSIRVYKASAGSGKTFTLSAEYIANLLNDFDPYDAPHRHQLAITFTNKATKEMKERIMQYLYELAYEDLSTVGILPAVRERLTQPLGDNAVKERARKTLHQILHGYDHFRVSTIDSFFQSLLTGLAHDLGLSAAFRVELNDKLTLSKAVTKMLRELRPGSQELDWVTRFIEQRLEDSESWNVSDALNKLAGELTKEPYMLNSDRLRALPLDNRTVHRYRTRIQACKEEAKQQLQDAAAAADGYIASVDGYKCLSHGNDWYKKFLLKYVQWDFPKDSDVDKVSWTSKDDFINDPPAKLLAKYKGKKDHLAADIAERFAELRTIADRNVPRIVSCELSTRFINPLRLIDTIDQEVREINREGNAFLLAHTPLLFNKLVGTEEVSFVFERAGTNFRHVMIDEFQDTSKLQWGNLRHLFCETSAAGNNSMLVGDVKQAIYRWRGGDWTALAGFEDDAETEIRHLAYNYRSGRRIVGFNNAFFVEAARVIDEDGPDESQRATHLFSPEEVHQKEHNDGGFVRIHVMPKSEKGSSDAPEDEENASDDAVEHELAEQIIRLRTAGVPYDKMAILVRKKLEAQRLLEFFESQNEYAYFREDPILLMSDEAFLLESSPAVQTIVHVLRAILDISDGVARAYIEAHMPPGRRDEVYARIETWQHENFRNIPFYELVERIIELFALHEEEGQSPYLYAFLDAVIDFLDNNIPDIATFLQLWDDQLGRQSIPSAAAKGVRILTVHKSKGLDFHTLFMPYCNWLLEEDRNDNLLWVEPREAPFDEIPFLPVPQNAKTGKSIYAADYVEEHVSQRIENLNLAYVAFTRPRQNLIVIAPHRAKGTSLRDVLGATLTNLGAKEDAWKTAFLPTPPKEENNETTASANKQKGKRPGKSSSAKENAAPMFPDDGEIIFELGEPSVLECTPKSNKEKARNPLRFDPETENVFFRIYERKVAVIQSNNAHLFNVRLHEDANAAAAADTVENIVARQRGEMLHAILAQVDDASQIRTVVERFADEGKLIAGANREELETALEAAVNQPEVRGWFDGSWRLYRECSILRKGSGPQRPDRVMTKDGKTIVVDYKFGARHDRYHEQVHNYCALLQKMGHTDVQGFVWYVFDGRVESVSL